MSVLLNDEEMLNIIDGNWAMSANDALSPRLIAKAQLKKVFIWGSEPCPHRENAIHKRCGRCWQVLLEEGE